MLINLNTWSSKENRMQEEITVKRLVIVPFGMVGDFKYLETKLTYQNFVQKEMKGRLK